MATITITGPVEVCDENTSERITDTSRLKVCDNVRAKSAKLAADLYGDLEHLGIAGGDLKLQYDAKQGCLLVVTTYEARERLAPKHLKQLVAYTREQWSDGAGEGAFYKLMDKRSISFDLSPTGSERLIQVEQTDAGGRKLKPTPQLAVAAEKGDIAAVKKLLIAGADINARGKYRQTALHTAILNQHIKLAGVLIQGGASVEAVDEHGSTALTTAVMAGDLSSTKRLIQAGADVDHRDKSGITPLMWAVNYGHVSIVKVLLENGADPNAKNGEGQTALMYARPAAKEIIDLLIAYGAQPEKPKPSAVAQALEKAQACETSGDIAGAKKWRELAGQLQKFSK